MRQQGDPGAACECLVGEEPGAAGCTLHSLRDSPAGQEAGARDCAAAPAQASRGRARTCPSRSSRPAAPRRAWAARAGPARRQPLPTRERPRWWWRPRPRCWRPGAFRAARPTWASLHHTLARRAAHGCLARERVAGWGQHAARRAGAVVVQEHGGRATGRGSACVRREPACAAAWRPRSAPRAGAGAAGRAGARAAAGPAAARRRRQRAGGEDRRRVPGGWTPGFQAGGFQGSRWVGSRVLVWFQGG